MATPVKKWLLRVAPLVFTGGHRGGVALASSVGWLSTRILPSPEGVVTAFWTLSAKRRNCGSIWRSVPGGR
ncbi:putative aliphatic sulfonates ABC transporter permease [Escherichia coli]|uniref:Putative aliphatic sulfonates ABC transporter permease n=1 Tax=Escherichia coli TaxID=562 RepID=A0A2X3KBJ6_ECOLX|nr:putative aliphatic sulfonates ABC transporter permease [Escherichia coli]